MKKLKIRKAPFRMPDPGYPGTVGADSDGPVGFKTGLFAGGAVATGGDSPPGDNVAGDNANARKLAGKARPQARRKRPPDIFDKVDNFTGY